MQKTKPLWNLHNDLVECLQTWATERKQTEEYEHEQLEEEELVTE